MEEDFPVVVRSRSLSDILESVFVVVRNVSKNMACPVEEYACKQEVENEVHESCEATTPQSITLS